jgi:IS5 family transposase
VKHKLIRGYAVTDAATHDGAVFNGLLDDANRPGVWADKNYRARERTAELRRRGLPDRMHWIGHKHRALTPYQERLNRARSRIRARVEHVFGYQENSMGGKLLRTIGLARAKVKLGLRNLGYNVARFAYLETRAQWWPG